MMRGYIFKDKKTDKIIFTTNENNYYNSLAGLFDYFLSIDLKPDFIKDEWLKSEYINHKTQPTMKNITVEQIEARIIDEYQKHHKHGLNWSKIAAQKIYSSLIHSDIIEYYCVNKEDNTISLHLKNFGACTGMKKEELLECLEDMLLVSLLKYKNDEESILKQINYYNNIINELKEKGILE